MPLRNSDRSSVGFTLQMQLPGSADFVTVPNVGDVEITSPAAPTETFKYLDGSSSQYSGTPDPETIQVNSSFQPSTDEYQALANAKISGNEMNFRLVSGDAQILFDSGPDGAGVVEVAIEQTGVVTFTNQAGGADKPLPVLGVGGRAGKYGKGDAIRVDNKMYRIVASKGTGSAEKFTVKDWLPTPYVSGDDLVAVAVAATAPFTIVKPKIMVDFSATVTMAGAFGASPSSPVPTDQIGLAVTSGLAGQWVPILST